MLQGNLGHIPCCQNIKEQISTNVFPSAQFAEKLSTLSSEFIRRFADFEAQKCRFELLSNLFAVDMESAPTNLQMELIELRCCDTLKSSMTLWMLHSLHVSSPTQCPNSIPKLLKCSLCSAAHIYVNSYSL